MRLPDQSPPVSRNPDRTHVRPTTDAPDQVPWRSSDGGGPGINPADYQDCYRLRGLAQQLCLNYY
jgi:hypothetical protein